MTDWASGIFGLCGVVLGAGLSSFWEFRSQRRSERKDAAYLAAIVTTELDRFSAKCLDVVNDDGTYRGQRDEHGELAPQVATPTFDPSSLKVDWRSLPVDLMYAILDLPYRIWMANGAIADAHEHASFPPDYEETFEERQFQYSTLGLKAIALSARLRTLAGHPAHEADGWNPAEQMTHARDKILAYRRAAAERHAATLAAEVNGPMRAPGEPSDAR